MLIRLECFANVKNRYQTRLRFLAFTSALMALPAGYINAAPTGGAVTSGAGTIDQSGATTTVNQTTERLGINWQSFDVNTDETVNFVQPSTSSLAVNRILGNNGSSILGNINANGHVVLINPNGIIFGKDATVNVGSLIASGLQINADDFLNGEAVFSAMEGTEGRVINAGIINAAIGGSVSLIGKQVQNDGLISAQLGSVNLLAGKEAVVTFDEGGLVGVRISQEILQEELGDAAEESATINNGEIRAESGSILLSASTTQNLFSDAVNAGELEQAQSVVVNNDGSFTLGGGARVINTGELNVSGEQGGSAVLVGESVENSGAVLADSAAGYAGHIELTANRNLILENGSHISAQSSEAAGGQIKLLGESVSLNNQQTVNTSGELGGGDIYIGGGYQGDNNLLLNAEHTFVGSDVSIKADAIAQGNGGQVIIWADNSTRYFGSLSGRGGITSGNGGFAEISGKQFLTFNGLVDLSATSNLGYAGTLLLDPTNITIDDSGSDSAASVDNTFNNNLPPDRTIDRDNIQALLDGGTSVTLQAANDIAVLATITSTGSGSLTLEASDDLRVESSITLGSGNLSLFSASRNCGSNNCENDSEDLDIGASNYGARLYLNADLTTIGGNIILGNPATTVRQANIFIPESASIAIGTGSGGGNVDFNYDIYSASNSATPGDLTVDAGTGDVTFAAAAGFAQLAGTGNSEDPFRQGFVGANTLGYLSVSTTGTVSLNEIVVAGGLTLDGVSTGLSVDASTIELNGNIFTLGDSNNYVMVGEVDPETVEIDGLNGTVESGGAMLVATEQGRPDDGHAVRLNGNVVIRQNASVNIQDADFSTATVDADAPAFGNIIIDTRGSETSGAVEITGSVTNEASNTGPSESFLDISADSLFITAATGDVRLGDVNTNGEQDNNAGLIPNSTNSIQITATTGSILANSLTANGGIAVENEVRDNEGALGNDAGAIALTAHNNITLTGAVSASGSEGIDLDDDSVRLEIDGGNGAQISILSTSGTGTISLATVTANGANGVSQDTGGSADASGGDAGAILINATNDDDPDNILVGFINLSGDVTSNGGRLFEETSTVADVSNGAASSITLIGNTNLLANTILSAALNVPAGSTGEAPAITGTVTLNGSTNSTAQSGLTVTAGDIVFIDTVGGTNELGEINLTATGNVVVGGSFNASDLSTFTRENVLAQSITIAATGVYAGDLDTLGTADENGGVVSLTATDGVISINNIVTTGGSAASNGRDGGDVALSAADISLESISTNGSAGSDVGADNGGDAGAITLTATASGDGAGTEGTPTITITGNVNAQGGDGLMVGASENASLIIMGDDETAGEVNLNSNALVGADISVTGNVDDDSNVLLVVGSATDDVVDWQINSDSGGTVTNTTQAGAAQISFTNVNQLQGDEGNDAFTFNASGAITGSGYIDGTVNGTNEVIGRNIDNIWRVTSANQGTLEQASDNSIYLSSFQNIQNLTGGTATDTLLGRNQANTWTIGTTNTLSETSDTPNDTVNFSGMEILTGNNGVDTFDINTAITADLNGGAGNDVFDIDAVVTSFSLGINGGDNDDTFDIDANLSGDVIGDNGNDTFNVNVQSGGNLDGLSDNDIYNISADFTGTADGEDGEDQFVVTAGFTGTLSGGGDADTFNVSADSSGNLNGNDGDDIFELSANVTGTVAGNDGADSFTISDENVSVTINGGTDADPDTSTDTLTISHGVASTWTFDGGNEEVTPTGGGAVVFSQLEEINASEGVDTVDITSVLAPVFNARGGNDVFNISANADEAINGGSDDDTFNINAAGISATVVGGAESTADTVVLTVDTGTNDWQLSDDNSGTLDANFAFSEIENITGDANSADTFTFNFGGTYSGVIDAGNIAGNDLVVVAADGDVAVTLGENLNGVVNAEGLSGNGTGSNLILTTSAETTWTVTDFDGVGTQADGVNDGTVTDGTNTLNIVNFGSWAGTNNQNDIFIVADDGAVGSLDGGTGTGTGRDTLRGRIGDNSNWLLTGDQAGNVSVDGGSTYAAFTNIEQLEGQATTDNLTGQNIESRWELSADDAGTINDGLASEIAFDGFSRLNGGSGDDTLVAPNQENNWAITAGVASVNTTNFTGMEILEGNANVDNFTFSTAFSGTANGLGAGDTFTINTAITGVLNGGAANDSFTFGTTGEITGTDSNIDGGAGSNTLTGRASDSIYNITAANEGNVTTDADVAYISSFENIQVLNGGTATDEIVGRAQANDWIITGAESGTVSQADNTSDLITFTEMETITGNDDVDEFDINAAHTGTINGGANNDVFFIGAATTATLNGGAGGDQFTVESGGSATSIVGGGDSDTLTAINQVNNWRIDGVNQGALQDASLNPYVPNFIGIENLVGSVDFADAFIFVNAAASVASITAGDIGTDTADYSGVSADISVTIGGSSVNGIIGIERVEGNNDGIGIDPQSTLILSGSDDATWLISDVDGALFPDFDGINDGTVANVEFINFNNLTGGSGNDRFELSSITTAGITGIIQGGDQRSLALTSGDELIGRNVETQWAISEEDTNGVTNGGEIAVGTADYASGSPTVLNVSTRFEGIERVEGGTAIDEFSVGTFNADGEFVITLDGGIGAANTLEFTDTNDVAITVGEAFGGLGLVGFSSITASGSNNTLTFDSAVGDDVEWSIASANNGAVGLAGGTTTSFINFQNLVGDDGDDSFQFEISGSVVMLDGQGGNNEILSRTNTNSTFVLAAGATDVEGAIAGYLTRFSNIQRLAGRGVSDTLQAIDQSNTWTINTTSSVANTSDSSLAIEFADMEVLTGGSGVDVFNINNAYAGDINAGSGDDLFVINSSGGLSGTVNGQLGNDTLQGRSEATRYVLDDGYAITATSLVTYVSSIMSIEELTAQGAGNTLVGPNRATTWMLNGTNNTIADNIDSTLVMAFSGVEALEAGSFADTFDILDAFSGEITSGVGSDIFNIDAPFVGNIDAGVGEDQFNVNAQVIGALNGDADADIFTIGNAGSLTGASVIAGGSGSDALLGRTTDSVWRLEGIHSGNIVDTSTYVSSFTGIETLQGRAITDELRAFDQANTWTLDGITNTLANSVDTTEQVNFSGMDVLTGNNNVDTFNIQSAYAGTLNGGNNDDNFNISASITANVFGDGGDDQFVILANGAVATGGSLDGGAGTANVLVGKSVDSRYTLTSNNQGFVEQTTSGSEGTYVSSFNNIEVLQAGNLNDELVGIDQNNTWVINTTSHSVANTNLPSESTAFSNIERLTGNNGIDLFEFAADNNELTAVLGAGGADVFTLTGIIAAALNGGNGDDRFEFNTLYSGDASGDSGDDVFAINAQVSSNLDGGANNDSFIFGVAGNSSGVLSGDAGDDTITGNNNATVWQLASYNSGSATAGGANYIALFEGIDEIISGAGVDELRAFNQQHTWTITGANNILSQTGSPNQNLEFSNIEVLTGGNQADIFALGANGITEINAGNGADQFTVSAAISTVVNAQAGDDIFVIAAGGSVSGQGVLDGGEGSNTLTGRNVNSRWELSAFGEGSVLNTDNADAVYAQFLNIQTFVGGNLSDELVGASQNNTWTISGAVNSLVSTDTPSEQLSFSNVEVVTGNGLTDVFNLNADELLAANGSGGNDIFNVNVSVTHDLSGGDGTDRFILANNGSVLGGASINGGGLFDTLTVNTPNTETTGWNISGQNEGSVNSRVSNFTAVENLTGGNGTDSFVFTNSASGLSGLINGAESTNVSDTLVDSVDVGVFTSGIVVEIGEDATATPSTDLAIADVVNIYNIEQVTAASLADETNNWIAVTHADDVNWNITSVNNGTVNRVDDALVMPPVDIANSDVEFFNFGSIHGGPGNTIANIVPGDGGNITGMYIEGSGLTSLNFSDRDGLVVINLSERVSGIVGNGNTLVRIPSDEVNLNINNEWLIDQTNAGSFTADFGGAEPYSVTFSGVNQLEGGTGSDIFNFDPAGNLVDGSINGGSGGVNIINAQAATTSLNFGLNNIANDLPVVASHPAGTLLVDALGSRNDIIDVINVSNLDASPSVITGLTSGSSGSYIWNIGASGINTIVGEGQSTTFTGIERIAGAAANDEFIISNLAGLDNFIDTGLGSDTVNIQNVSSATTLALNTAFDDAFIYVDNAETLVGNGVSSTIVANDANNTWQLDNGVNAGSIVNEAIEFSGFTDLQGGALVDTFNVTTGSVTGSINAGEGADALNLLVSQNVTTNFEFDGGDTTAGVADQINLTGDLVSDLTSSAPYSAAYSVLSTGQEQLLYSNNASAFSLRFAQVENVSDRVMANTLVVNSGVSPSTINFETNAFSVDNLARVFYTDKTNVTVSANVGDQINLLGAQDIDGQLVFENAQVNASPNAADVITANAVVLDGVGNVGDTNNRLAINTTQLSILGASGDIYVSEFDALDITALNSSGVVDIVAGESIDVSGVITSSAMLNFTSNNGNITAPEDGNTLSGLLNLSAANDIVVANSTRTNLGDISAQNLDVRSVGNIEDDGLITITRETILRSENNITLDNPLNTFNSLRVVEANNVAIVDAGGLTINQIDSVGSVAVSSFGLTLNDGIAGTDIALNAGAGALITNNAVDATGDVALSGASVTLNNVVSATQNITVDALVTDINVASGTALQANTLNITAANDAVLDQLTAEQADITAQSIVVNGLVTATNLSASASDADVIFNEDIISAGDVDLFARQSVQTQGVVNAVALTINALGSAELNGDITTTNALNVTGAAVTQGANVAINGDVVAVQTQSGDFTMEQGATIVGEAVSIVSALNTNLQQISSDTLTVSATNGVVNQQANLSAAGDIRLTQNAFSARANDVSIVSTNGLVEVVAVDEIVIANIAAQNVNVRTTGALTLLESAVVASNMGDVTITADAGIELRGDVNAQNALNLSSLNGDIAQQQTISATGDINVSAGGQLAVSSTALTSTAAGNVSLSGSQGIALARVETPTEGDAAGVVRLNSSNGNVLDLNGDEVNVIAQRLDAQVQSGFGAPTDAIEVSIDNIFATSAVGGINLDSTQELTVDGLRSNGDITIRVREGDLIANNEADLTYDRTQDADALAAGGIINAGYGGRNPAVVGGVLSIEAENGDIRAIGRASGLNGNRDLDNPDFAGFIVNFEAPNGSVGGDGFRVLSIYANDIVSVSGQRAWQPQWSFNIPPNEFINTASIQADASEIFNALGELLIEIEELGEIDEAIFTDVRNYSHDNISILMPRSQRYDDDDEEQEEDQET